MQAAERNGHGGGKEIAGRHWEEEAEAERWHVAQLPEVRRPDWGLHS